MCRNPDVRPTYVGQTTNFVLRKSQHRQASKTKQTRVYEYIREMGGFDNWNMILIEEYPCKNNGEALKREMELVIENHAELNACSLTDTFPTITTRGPIVKHINYLTAAVPESKRMPTEYETWMKITAWIRTIVV